MTKSCNFPHMKHLRRVGAAERLAKALNALEPTAENFLKIRRIEKEWKTLVERTKGGGGRKSTKKVHSNTGRKG